MFTFEVTGLPYFWIANIVFLFEIEGMLSLVIRGLVLLLCGCQIQEQSENVAKILETVEVFRKDHRIQEAIDYLTCKGIYKNLDLLETLAFLYEENKESLLAAQTFEQLFHADIDKQYIECAFHAAEIYYQLGDIYSAGRCYRLYLELNPQDHSIWFKLSAIEEQLGHPANALTAYFNGLDTIPIKAETHLKKLSELCYNNGMLKAAEFWGQVALKVQPEDVTTLEILLKVADAHNDRHKVMFYIQRLEARDPHFSQKHSDLYTKYAYKDPIDAVVAENGELVIPHNIHATQQEIEYTLQLLSQNRVQHIRQKPTVVNISVPLCPKSIY